MSKVRTFIVAGRTISLPGPRKTPLPTRYSPKRTKEFFARAKDFIERVVAAAVPMPASQTSQGRLSYKWFAQYADISQNAAQGKRISALAEATAKQLGCAVWHRHREEAPPTLAEARVHAIRCRRKANDDARIPRDTGVDELRVVFARAAAGKEENLLIDAPRALERMRRLATTADMKRTIREALDFAIENTKQLAAPKPLPADFRGRFQYAVRRKGITLVQLGHLSKVNKVLLHSWNSDDNPSPKNDAAVIRIERALKTERGFLLDPLVAARGLVAEDFPPGMRGPLHRAARKRIRRRLPRGWRKLPMARRMRLIEDMCKTLEEERKRSTFNHRIRLLKRYGHHHSSWHKKLLAEFETIRAHHQEGVEEFPFPSDTTWRDSTVRKFQFDCGLALGFFLIDPKDPVTPEDLSFALMADWGRLKRLLDFQRKRSTDCGHPDKYSTTQVAFVRTCARLFEIQGAIRQDENMRRKFGFGRRPLHQWEAHCDRMAGKLRYLEKLARSKAGKKGEPQENTLTILEMDRPLAVVKLLADGFGAKWRALAEEGESDEKVWALQQDEAYVHIHAQAPLRPDTTVQLTCSPDLKSGHVRRDALGYYIVSPARLFKNEDGEAMFHGLRRRLHNEWGTTEVLDRFFDKARRGLLGTLASPFVFAYGRENLRGFIANPSDTHKITRSLSGRFIRQNEAIFAELDIEGVYRLTPTDLRDIVATDVDNEAERDGLGDSPEMAAESINDRVGTTKRFYLGRRLIKRRKRLLALQTHSAKAAATAARDSIRAARDLRRQTAINRAVRRRRMQLQRGSKSVGRRNLRTA